MSTVRAGECVPVHGRTLISNCKAELPAVCVSPTPSDSGDYYADNAWSQMSSQQHICVDIHSLPEPAIYVSDSNSYVVLKYSLAHGRLIRCIRFGTDAIPTPTDSHKTLSMPAAKASPPPSVLEERVYVPFRPCAMCVDRDELYICNYTLGVSVFDRSNEHDYRRFIIPTLDYSCGNGIVVNGASDRMFISSTDIVCICRCDGTLLRTLLTAHHTPRGLCVNPARNELFVSRRNSPLIHVLNTCSGEALRTISAPEAGMRRISAYGDRIFVCMSTRIDVLHRSRGDLLATIKLSGQFSDPEDVVFEPITQSLYVLDSSDLPEATREAMKVAVIRRSHGPVFITDAHPHLFC